MSLLKENKEKPTLIQIDNGTISGTRLQSNQPLYPLKEVDFVRLKMKESKFTVFSGYVLAGVIGYIFSNFYNFMDLISNKNINALTSTDYWAVGGGLLFSLILFSLGNMLPNERTKTMKDITNYFKEFNK